MNTEYIGTATYSPDDNKLRLYPFARLDAETYGRLKTAGFKWAPKQELFVAPMWTPGRFDMLEVLCGEVGDDDSSLTERATERAERFEEYADKRADDADRTHDSVKQITDGIPFGQPILVGHHSEKHARRDAARIENGMRKAVKMWETSEHWQYRAAAALRNAKYKERPDVRARRIKKIEADKRRQERAKQEAQAYLKLWENLGNDEKWKTKPDGSTPTIKERALAISNRDYISRSFPLVEYPREAPASQYEGPMALWSALDGSIISGEQAAAIAIPCHRRTVDRATRWLAHYDHRLAYERAMMGADGGTASDKTGPEKGGAVKCWAAPRGGWAYIQKVNKVSVTLWDNWGNGGANFRRTIPFDKLQAVMTAADVDQARREGRLAETPDGVGFFLREGPAPDVADDRAGETRAERNERAHVEHVAQHGGAAPAAPLTALKEALRARVQVASVPQLFPTPPDLARRMVRAADLEAHHRVLEPSAGTGVLVKEIGDGPDTVAVEINEGLAERLTRLGVSGVSIRCADFLECGAELGAFDRIIMNPPFTQGADIKHIEHAAKMLKPGGRLIALCANGPRQNEKLRPRCSSWEQLPAGTFREVGTNVSVAMLTIDAPPEGGA